MEKLTTISNYINQGKYEISDTPKETEKERQLYRGLKEKEKELLHLVYYKFNQLEDFKPIEFQFEELIEDIGIDLKNSAYAKEIFNRMAKLITTFQSNSKRFTTFPIFAMFDYNPEEKKIVIEFNEKLIDYLYCDKDIKLIKKWGEYKKKKRTLVGGEVKEFKEKHKGNFTITSHLEITKLKSSYAMELYEKLSQFKKAKEKVYSIKELRELLSIPKSYSPSMIKKQILEIAKKQISENTNIKIDYEVIGTGQRQEIKFMINFNEKRVKPVEKKEIKNFYLEVEEREDKEQIQTENQKELIDFRKKALKQANSKLTQSRYFEFHAKVIPLKSEKEIEELCREFGFLLNEELFTE